MTLCVVFSPLILTVLFWRESHGMDLELAQLVFRHGDRSAVMSFATDPCKESCWHQGFGQLTQVGMRQHYVLGQFLSDRYRQQHTLINITYYDSSEVYIRSTDIDRTLMSAEALLSGLYPPHGFQEFRTDLPWQPIPVHTVPGDQDSLLRPFDNCPRYTEIYNLQDQRSYYQEKTKKEQSFMDWVQKKSGVTFPLTLSNIYKIDDTLFCQEQHNITLPQWVDQSVQDHLEELKNFGMTSMFVGNEAHRLTSGPLISEMLHHMASKENDTTSQEKLYLYSAHDTTVAAFLSGLEIFNGIQPPYASAVLVELYSQNQSFYVQIFYRNETEQEDTQLFDLTAAVPGCTQSPCPLETFKRFALTVVPENWPEECQEKDHSSSKDSDRGVIIGFTIGGFMIVALFVIISLHCRKRMLTSYSKI